jgi:hypothetical protein
MKLVNKVGNLDNFTQLWRISNAYILLNRWYRRNADMNELGDIALYRRWNNHET